MKCEFCGHDMSLDYIDYNSKGKRVYHYICPCCGSSCIPTIRNDCICSVDFEVSRSYEEYLIYCEFSDDGSTELMSFIDYLNNVLKEKEKCTD